MKMKNTYNVKQGKDVWAAPTKRSNDRSKYSVKVTPAEKSRRSKKTKMGY